MNVSVGNGFLGLVILILDIWAIINIVQSNASNGAKVLWGGSGYRCCQRHR